MKFTAIAFAALTFLTSEAGARESTLLRASKNEDKANPASGGNPQADALQCYEKCSHSALDSYSISVKSMDVEEEREVRLGKNKALSSAEEEIEADLNECTSECASEAQEAAARSNQKFNETAAANAVACYGVCNAEAAEDYVDEAEKDIKKELKGDYGKDIKDEKDCGKVCEGDCKGEESDEAVEACEKTEAACEKQCEKDFKRAVEDAEKDAAKKAEKSLDKCAEGCTEAALPFLFVKTGRTSTQLRASKVAARVGSGTGGTGDDSDTLDGCVTKCGDKAIKDYSIPSSGWTAASEDEVSLRKSKSGDTDKQEAELTADITACASTCVASASAAATRSGQFWNQTVADEATECVISCSSLAAAAYYDEVESEISKDMKEWGSIDEEKDCEDECEGHCPDGDTDCDEVEDCVKPCEDAWDKALDDAEKEGTKEAQDVYDSCLVTCVEPASKMFAALEIA